MVVFGTIRVSARDGQLANRILFFNSAHATVLVDFVKCPRLSVLKNNVVHKT